ncbi:MAG: hypothetical protein ABEJ62_00545 [Candidatus Nanohaloarchaea archaeon]
MMTEYLEPGRRKIALFAFLGGFLTAGIAAGGLIAFQLTGANTDTGVSEASAKLSQEVQQVRSEVIPEKGSSTGYGAHYSNDAIKKMVSWEENTELSGETRQRYIDLGSRKGTSCEYCCGATSALTENGRIACGCNHNIALAGLVKHLVKETDMTDKEIMAEIRDWKGFFFPKQVLKEELQKRGISPSAAGLPRMRGGC